MLARGVLLFVDYGMGRREYYSPARDRGTLRCHFRQRAHDDPFVWPGLQDITAQVDFTAVAEGGIAVALAEMTIGGDTGANIDLQPLTHHIDESNGEPLRADHLLFSETPTRWVLQAVKGQEDALLAHFQAHGVPLERLGTPGGDLLTIRDGTRSLLALKVDAMRDTWKHALGRLLGEHGGDHA
jgi:hypothetical protein